MGGPSSNLTVILMVRGNQGADTHKGKAVWRHREKMVIYKLSREILEETT